MKKNFIIKQAHRRSPPWQGWLGLKKSSNPGLIESLSSQVIGTKTSNTFFNWSINILTSKSHWLVINDLNQVKRVLVVCDRFKKIKLADPNA